MNQPPTDKPEPTFRERVLAKMVATLGQPQVLPVVGGEIYRWTLARLYDVNLYVTVDSPEHPFMAHIMLSDGARFQKKPVESFIVERMEDADALIERIVLQWKKKRDPQ